MNNLNGTIPPCVNNLTDMVHGRLSESFTHRYSMVEKSVLIMTGTYFDYVMMEWQGKERELTNSNVSVANAMSSKTELELCLKFANQRYQDGSFNGIIPNFIGSMTQLRYLDLSDNSFNGTIPNFIGSMTQLRYLDLSWNSFNGSIPKSIGSMTQLRYLDVSHNDFNGTIAKSIGSLTLLRYLDVSVNFLHGNIPPEFGNLITLRNLSLGPSYGGTISVDPFDYIVRCFILDIDVRFGCN
ncbi:hypothetical protein OSB04_011354, partial [Centaurea solstitialis]